jgi:hypothetical protein
MNRARSLLGRAAGLALFFSPVAAAGAQQPGAPPASDEVLVTPAPPPDSPPVEALAPPPIVPPAENVEEPAGAVAAAAEPGPSGWNPDQGFVLVSQDASYKFRLGLQSAYKFEPVYQEGEFRDRRSFFVLRPIFAGNFYKDWIRFWTSLELNGNPPFLLDSYVEIQPVKAFGARIGQQYTLISRHEQFGPQQILFPEWSPVAEYFWTGRDKGVTLWGFVADDRFEYYAGAYTGSPLRQFRSLAGNYVFEARVVWNPLGATGTNEFPYIADAKGPWRVSGSLQGYLGKVQFAEENFNPSSFRFDIMPTGEVQKQLCGAADIWLQGPWFATTGEAYLRATDPDGAPARYTSWGVWGQAGFLLVPRTLDFALRFNYLDPTQDLDNDTFISGEAQLAYYVTQSQNLVVKLRYGIGSQESPGEDALGAVNLFTDAGDLQIATVQLNLAF